MTTDERVQAAHTAGMCALALFACAGGAIRAALDEQYPTLGWFLSFGAVLALARDVLWRLANER